MRSREEARRSLANDGRASHAALTGLLSDFAMASIISLRTKGGEVVRECTNREDTRPQERGQRHTRLHQQVPNVNSYRLFNSH